MFFALHLAISRVVQFDIMGLKVFGLVSALCIFAQMDLENVSLLSHDNFIDFQKWEMLIMHAAAELLLRHIPCGPVNHRRVVI